MSSRRASFLSTLTSSKSQAVFHKLQNEPVSLSHLQPSLALGLQTLLDYEAERVEEDYCRTFVGEFESFGEIVQVPLISGGEDIAVTGENRQGSFWRSSVARNNTSVAYLMSTRSSDYVDRLVHFHLTSSISDQFNAFAAGFNSVASGDALSFFSGNYLARSSFFLPLLH